MQADVQRVGQERLDAIMGDRLAGKRVDQGRMFSTVGWRRGGKVFAFVTHDGELMVKIAADRVQEVIAAGIGTPMTIRERTMREWVRIPSAGDWEPFVVEAHAFGRD